MQKEIETKIKNTLMKERYNDEGVKVNYIISAADGYKLHDNNRDEVVLDEEGNETGEIIKGYTKGIVTVLADYDFDKNQRELYAVEE